MASASVRDAFVLVVTFVFASAQVGAAGVALSLSIALASNLSLANSTQRAVSYALNLDPTQVQVVLVTHADKSVRADVTINPDAGPIVCVYSATDRKCVGGVTLGSAAVATTIQSIVANPSSPVMLLCVLMLLLTRVLCCSTIRLIRPSAQSQFKRQPPTNVILRHQLGVQAAEAQLPAEPRIP